MAWKLSCAAEEPSAAAAAAVAAGEGMEGIAGVEEETEGNGIMVAVHCSCIGE